jgi:hypothetical protein
VRIRLESGSRLCAAPVATSSVHFHDAHSRCCALFLSAGFEHSAYAFGHESFIYKSSLESSSIPPGALISFVQKGLQYAEIESHINEDGTETICEESFSLMKKHQCKPRPAKRKIFNAFDSLDADYGALEIDDARMLRTELSAAKGDHLGTSGMKNMAVCLLWHPYVPSEKNSKRSNPLADQQQNTLLTAMADGALKIWEWREEEEESKTEENTAMTDAAAPAAAAASSSPTPKQPFQKGYVCIRTIPPPSTTAAAASSSPNEARPAAASSSSGVTKSEDDMQDTVSGDAAAAASSDDTNKRQKLADGSALALNGLPADEAKPAAAAPAATECHVNTNQSIVAIDWHVSEPGTSTRENVLRHFLMVAFLFLSVSPAARPSPPPPTPVLLSSGLPRASSSTPSLVTPVRSRASSTTSRARCSSRAVSTIRCACGTPRPEN